MTDTGEVLDALEDAGFSADMMHPPTEISVAVPHLEGYLFLTRGHNRDGWEAAFDDGFSQEPLDDGPEEDADPQRVVRWVRQLVVQAEENSLS